MIRFVFSIHRPNEAKDPITECRTGRLAAVFRAPARSDRGGHGRIQFARPGCVRPALGELLADDSLLKKTVIVDGEVAGNIGSWTAEGKREVGYWIDRAFWGRGVATEALSAFLDLEPIRPLHAGVAKHNVASIRVLQKCGFKLSHSVEEASNDADASHVLLTLTA